MAVSNFESRQAGFEACVSVRLVDAEPEPWNSQGRIGQGQSR